MELKLRQVKVVNTLLTVPSNIQRIKFRDSYGWQIRYGVKPYPSAFDQTKDQSDAAESLKRAIDILIERISRFEAPAKLKFRSQANKTTDLPKGVSGPIRVHKKGRKNGEWMFQMTLPVFGKKAKNATEYIGTDTTYTKERELAKLSVAIGRVAKAENLYREQTTKAKRQLVELLSKINNSNQSS